MANRSVSFSNFICRFGEKLVLLDLFDEVVLPAFTNSSFKRSYAETEYFFYDVRLINIDGSEPAIAGRFVKNTIYLREQVFEAGVLKPSPQKIESAPSSLFVLTLSDHKLLFYPEVANAPGIQSFRTTAEKFLRAAHEHFIRATHKHELAILEEGGKKPTFKALIEKYPRPTLDVVPLNSADSFRDFVDGFGILKELEIRIIKSNNELNNNKWFDGFRRQADHINAASSVIDYRNPEGLIKDVVYSHAEKALDGNAVVVISGTDKEGRKVSGSNDDFKVTVPITNVPKSVAAAAQIIFELFNSYKGVGGVRVAAANERAGADEKIRKIIELFKSFNDAD